jgi:hypothetical protein
MSRSGSPARAKPSSTDGCFINFMTLPSRISKIGRALITRPVHRVVFETVLVDCMNLSPPEIKME